MACTVFIIEAFGLPIGVTLAIKLDGFFYGCDGSRHLFPGEDTALGQAVAILPAGHAHHHECMFCKHDHIGRSSGMKDD